MEELSPALAALYEGRRDEAERLTREPDVLEAAALGRNEELRALVERDPSSLDARTPEGFSPLHLAAFFGGAGAVKVLLAVGASADADSDNQLKVRPLHSAAAARDVAAVRALLEAGADPNVRQQGGFTPLLAAAHADDPALVQLLLDHGADPSQAADDGRDPASMAGPKTKALLGG